MTCGVMRASSNILTFPPENGGNFVSEIGTSRATSAFACATVVSGFSRAMAV